MFLTLAEYGETHLLSTIDVASASAKSCVVDRLPVLVLASVEDGWNIESCHRDDAHAAELGLTRALSLGASHPANHTVRHDGEVQSLFVLTRIDHLPNEVVHVLAIDASVRLPRE